MILPPAESKRFFRVWWPLLHFTNRELRLFPKLLTAPSNGPPPTMEAAYRIRTALWKDRTILQRFVKENPYGLVAEDLSLAASWKHRVEGTFFVFRHLKRHSILIDESDSPRAFAVQGITSSFSDLLGPEVPLATQAVLLPFDDKIVCDGLLAPYPVVFGNGIRRDLKEAYDRIRERDVVIESLPPSDRASKRDPAAIRRRNAKLLAEFKRYSYLVSRSSATVERDVEALQALAETMLGGEAPHMLLDLSRADIRTLVRSGARSASQSVARFIGFLAETGRINPGPAQSLRAAACGVAKIAAAPPGP